MKKIIILFIPAIILLFFYNFFTFHQQEQFVHLAYSFLQGKFYFLYPPPHWGDTTYYSGKHYWPLGPFPAVLLMPFVYIFGTHMQQGYLAFFLNILNAGVWGMSILFTSPVFIWIFFSPWKRIEVKAASAASLTILFLILGYYGIGGWQYGYRYAVDLYPFLFIILVYALKKRVTFMFSLVAILSFINNSYLIITSFRDPFKFF